MQSQKKIKVIIADDHHMVLDGLEALIKSTEDIEVIGLAYNGHHAFKLLELNQLDVDIAVLDIDMPVQDGLETTRKIRAEYPNIKVLILTMHNNESYIKETIAAGASGYILKNKGSNELVNAIRAIHSGEEYFSKAVTDTLIKSIQESKKAKPNPKVKLTKREKEVLALIGEGMTTKEISKQLFIANTTVETHRRNLIDKLGVKNSKELVLYAIKDGFSASRSDSGKSVRLNRPFLNTSRLDLLTRKEKKVLLLIGEGLSTKEIAKKLSIADSTVETHRTHLIEKLQLNTTKDLIIYTVVNKLLESPLLTVEEVSLNTQEEKILSLIGQGLSSKEIEQLTSIAAHNVDTYRRNLISKLGLNNSKELIRHAIERGAASFS
ncbi:LuxR family transcriptional regulator [uncultured Microscilla sp.]|uniref:LuxR family transcriptional regulator n=1 Tax=uncultured Microscilla sp. TaxID=432653 RepID=UPI0026140F5C|nr:LuxR family transcriptional regulator [uncultured Microscilla sp.]